MHAPKPSLRPTRRGIRGTHRQTLCLLALATSCVVWLVFSTAGVLP